MEAAQGGVVPKQVFPAPIPVIRDIPRPLKRFLGILIGRQGSHMGKERKNRRNHSFPLGVVRKAGAAIFAPLPATHSSPMVRAHGRVTVLCARLDLGERELFVVLGTEALKNWENTTFPVGREVDVRIMPTNRSTRLPSSQRVMTRHSASQQCTTRSEIELFVVLGTEALKNWENTTFPVGRRRG